MLQIIGKCFTLDEFRKYAREYDYGSIKPNSLVVHHTWSPTKAQWKGASSLEGIRNYYENTNKWSAGPHFFIAEDGIWLFTPMKEVGIHAGEGNATWRNPLTGKETQGFSKPFGSQLKSYSLGMEVVGDYDATQWSGKTRENALGVLKVLMGHLQIPTESVYFHRDFPSARKSCPGNAITKDWLFAELSKLDSDGKFVGANAEPAPWAKEAWEWQRNLGIDLSVLPDQKVDAQFVFAIIHKLKSMGQI